MSRIDKKWWVSIFAVVAIAIGVAACSSAPAAPAQAPAQQPAAQATAAQPAAQAQPAQKAAQPAASSSGGKVLKMARNSEPFSPFIPWQIDDNPALFISVNVYDTLFRTTKDGKGVEPALAEKYEASQDGLTWTFHLKDGVKFSDGTPMKASDFAASLNAARSSKKSVWADSYKAIKDVTAPDDKTLVITLSQPYAPLLSVLAMFSSAVLPADLVKASEAENFDNATAWKTRGTGAYMVDGWKKGDPLILKANPNYWKGKPDISEVDIEYIPDDNTRVLKLQGGETDVIDFVPFSQIDTLNASPGIKAQTFDIQQDAFVMLNNKQKPLDDVKVRQALAYATPKDAIIKNVYFGQAKPQNSPIPAGTYWDPNLQAYPYDLDKAKALMAQSSVPNGFKLPMQVRSGNTNFANTAVILKDAWSKIGVDVDIQNVETAVARQSYRDGSYWSQPTAWTNDMNDPTEIVNYGLRGDGPSFAYWTRYNNPALNDMITKADLEQDPKKREQMYHDIQKMYQDDAPFIPLVYLGATAGWRDYVQNFFIDGLSYYRFEDVKLNK
ncbi:MAG: ABC transporter substrate-binding protein [Anaerolineae bacterium]